MKRIACVLLVLCLVPVVSVCEDYVFVTNYIESLLESYGCKAFPEEYYTTYADDSSEIRHFFLSENVKVAVTTNGKTTNSIGASCFDENELHDFLVACYACLTAFGASSASAGNAVFFSYLEAVNGNSRLNTIGTDIFVKMIYKESNHSYTFVVIKAENR